MHNEIVVGLDDSPSGMAALQWAAAEAIRSHALRAVHALSWPFDVEHASCPVVAVPPALGADVAQNPGPVLDHTNALASA